MGTLTSGSRGGRKFNMFIIKIVIYMKKYVQILFSIKVQLPYLFARCGRLTYTRTGILQQTKM